jgi:hypothetical protein
VLLDYYHHSPGACESSFENYQNLEQSGIDSFAKIDSAIHPLDELDSSYLTSSHQDICMSQHNIEKIG